MVAWNSQIIILVCEKFTLMAISYGLCKEQLAFGSWHESANYMILLCRLMIRIPNYANY